MTKQEFIEAVTERLQEGVISWFSINDSLFFTFEPYDDEKYITITQTNKYGDILSSDDYSLQSDLQDWVKEYASKFVWMKNF